MTSVNGHDNVEGEVKAAAALLLPCWFHFHFCFLFSSIIFGLLYYTVYIRKLNMFACHDQNEKKTSLKITTINLGQLQPVVLVYHTHTHRHTHTHTSLAEPRPVRSGFTVNAAKELKHLQFTLEPAAAEHPANEKEKKTTANGYVIHTQHGGVE